MRKNKNVGLIVIFISLVMFYIVFQRDNSTASLESNFLNLDSASISKITLVESGTTTVLEKINDKWMVDNYKVDERSIGNALHSLADIKLSRKVSDREERQSYFEVTDEKGLKVIVTNGVNEHTFFIGKQGASYKSVFLRKDGDSNVYSSKENFKGNLSKKNFEWKDKTILSIPKKEITSLEITVDGKNSVLIQNKDSLNMVSGTDPKKEPVVKGNNQTNSMMGLFASFNTIAFPKDVEADFSSANLLITINKVNGEKVEVACVPNDEKSYFVKTSISETIFQVNKYVLENFEKHYEDLKE